MSEVAVLEAPIPSSTPPAPPTASADQTQSKPAPAPSLIVPRDQAAAHIQAQIQRGNDVKALRIRNGQELDQARAAKLEWTSYTTDLLNHLFDNPSVAEQCSDWVGKIYPEYAEFGNFVEQFYAEMDHRLGRLKGVLKRIEKMRLAVPQMPAANAAGVQTSPAASGDAAATSSAPAANLIEPPTLLDDLAGLLVVRKVDEASRQAVAELLEALAIDVSIAEQAQDMADVLDRNRQVRFAVVVSGEAHLDHSFELGYCAGRVGLNRVVLLKLPQAAENAPLEIQNHGLTQIVLDAGGGWQLRLARHLKRAGLPIDLDRLC